MWHNDDAIHRGLFSTFKTNFTGSIINLPFFDKGCALMWGLEILTWQWLLPGHDPKSFPVHRWWLSSLNRGTPRLRVPRVAPLRSYNKHVSAEIPPRPQARPAGFSLVCFIASFVFGGKTKLQWAERWAGNNCRPACWSIGIAATAMKPQLTSAVKCNCVSVTACVCVCVLVLNITTRIVDWVLSWHLCDSRNDDRLRARQTLNKEALSNCFLAVDNSLVDRTFNEWGIKASTCSLLLLSLSQVNFITYIDLRAPPTQREAR